MKTVTGTLDDRPAINPWLPMAAIMAGTVMVVLDSTIVNVALTAIGLGLHAGAGVEWVVTAYLLGVCASQPACGWAADRFGRKEVYLASLVAFTVTSLVASLATNLPELVVARGLQGVGGGALLPVGMAIVLDVFPRAQHGPCHRHVGDVGDESVPRHSVPTFGGWLVTAVSWNWLFRINVPIGVVCVVLGIRLLPRTTSRLQSRLDSAGLFFGVVGLSLTVLGLSQGNSWGWGSPATVTCLGVGVASSWWFVRHELATSAPLLELRMLSHRAFRLTLIIVLFVKVSEFGRLVYLALELTGVRGYTPLRVGLIFMPCSAVHLRSRCRSVAG